MRSGLAVGLWLVVVAGCGGDTDPGVTSANEVTTTLALPAAPTVSTTSVPVTTTEPPDALPAPMFDLAAGASADGWSVVNDTVMGGVSSGRLAVADGMLVFTGELSLDNNGGFASVRSPLIDPALTAAWADADGPRLVVEGDGRTWTVEVRTGDPEGGWVATLPTSAGGVTDTVLPWDSFVPVNRFLGRREASEPLEPLSVTTIAFYLVDGVEAPFRLGIRSIS